MWILLLAACGADDRALLTVPVTLRGAAAEVSPVDGVSVTLTEATFTLADVRLVGHAKTAWRWSPVPVAHAHPGHDFAGEVTGELAGTWTVDLLGGDTRLGDAACYEGDYASGRFSLRPDPVVVLAGSATVDGVATPFRFEFAPDQEITGLTFETTMRASAPPTAVWLSADLAHALSFVDWRTPDADGDATLTTADGALANTVLFGVVATPAWTLSVE